MNLLNKSPTGQKQPKAKPDPAYLRKVRSLPCCICEAWGYEQTSPTTAHHVIMGRYGNVKTPDRAAIPLCDGCHQGTFDTTKIAIHREPELWRATYGPDTDWTAPTQDKIEATG